MKALRKFWLRLFPRYKRLELCFVTYSEGDKLIRLNEGKPESEQWVLAIPEEDNNHAYGYVWLERKERILQ